MARVKGGVTSRRRRKKIMQRAEGFYSMNGRAYIHALEKTDRAMQYMFRDRKVRKRDFRMLWIARIGAACKLNGTNYSRLMGALHKAGLEINRKSLSEMAVHDAAGFSALVQKLVPAAAQ